MLRLSEFHGPDPKVDVRIVTSVKPITKADDPFDIAILVVVSACQPRFPNHESRNVVANRCRFQAKLSGHYLARGAQKRTVRVRPHFCCWKSFLTRIG